MLKLFNSLSKKIEDFKPLKEGYAGMYACGPTVYDYTHIGHLRKYIGDDILKNVLIANGLNVKHVMNITDVGHLTSDADEGDDKLEKGARERNMTVWEVAKYFEDYFFKSTAEVNILRPDIVCRATEHIKAQIKLIEQLEKNGFTYKTDQAIYFDISKFPDYTKLSGQKLEDKKTERSDVVQDKQKKNPQDFALWFFTIGHFKDHVMKWDSPWGEGFPGWHIECSAMSMEYLGESFDIHTGGIDHIPLHHTNEIAQSEGATGRKFVNFWVHHGWLLVDGKKMSKSQKNFYKIEEIIEKGIDPLSLRYLFLTAHYRDMLNFTWESLTSANNALNNLREEIRAWEKPKGDVGQFYQKFLESANNDLNMPQAVAVMWELVRSNTPTSSKAADLLAMDKIMGLKLDEYLGKPVVVPEKVSELIKQREHARRLGDFEKSDELRKDIQKLGFEIEDTSTGPRIKKSS